MKNFNSIQSVLIRIEFYFLPIKYTGTVYIGITDGRAWFNAREIFASNFEPSKKKSENIKYVVTQL